MTVKWHGLKAERAFEDGSETGIHNSLDTLLTECLLIVPLEFGDLQRSGRIETKGMTGLIEFGGSPCDDPIIAVVQHEHLEFKHKLGRQAKYLEEPLLQSIERTHRTIGKALWDRLHRG